MTIHRGICWFLCKKIVQSISIEIKWIFFKEKVPKNCALLLISLFVKKNFGIYFFVKICSEQKYTKKVYTKDLSRLDLNYLDKVTYIRAKCNQNFTSIQDHYFIKVIGFNWKLSIATLTRKLGKLFGDSGF